MKKRNKNLSKRLLASSLALAMCASMVCTTAFAEGAQDYAYVYINVTPGTAQTDQTDPAPTFQDYLNDEANKGTIAAANQAKQDAADAVSAADQAVTTAQGTVGTADQAVKDAEEAVDTAKSKAENAKDVLDTDTFKTDEPTLSEKIEEAKNGVVGSLNNLVDAVPEFNGEKPTVEHINNEDAAEDFVGTVESKIENLEIAREETQGKEGDDHQDAVDARSALESLNGTAQEVKDSLSAAQAEAVQAVKDANEAVQKAQEAYDTKKSELQGQLDTALANLNKPSETAPDRDSFTTQADYEDAYDEWVGLVNAYNGRVDELTALYTTNDELLKAEETLQKEQNKLTGAENVLQKAEEDIAKFDALDANFDTAYGDDGETSELMQSKSELIEAYRTALEAYKTAAGAYNGKISGYTEAAQAYDDAVQAYKNALQAYNDKVTAYNTAVNGTDKDGIDVVDENGEKVDGYNDKVDAYKEAVDHYNEVVTGKDKDGIDVVDENGEKVDGYDDKVDAYNAAVKAQEQAKAEYNKTVIGGYNDSAIDYNQTQTSKASGKIDQDILAELEGLKSDITAKKTDVDAYAAANYWSTVTDEEYNAKVADYQAKVTAYNQAIQNYNDYVRNTYNEAVNTYNTVTAVENKLAEVAKYFPGQEAHPDKAGGYWYTVGRIDVSGIFSKTPEQILKQNLSDSNKDYNAPKDGSELLGNKASDGELTYYGRDIYHFFTRDPKTEKVSGTPTDDLLTKNNWNAGSIYTAGDERGQQELLNRLTNPTVDYYTTPDKSGNVEFDPYTDVNRWVLKVSYGADNYQYRYWDKSKSEYVYTSEKTRQENGRTVDNDKYAQNKETFHVDGYVYADTLNTLSMLEKITWVDADLLKQHGVQKTATQYDKKDTETGKPDWAETTLKEAGVTAPEQYTWHESVDSLDPNTDKPTYAEEIGTVNSFVPGTLTGSADPITITDPFVPTPTEEEGDPTTPDGGGTTTPPPVVTVPDEDVPLAEEPVIDIPEEEVPLEEAPEEVEILDGDVPLADVPKTGDISAMWYAVTLASACGLAVLALRRKENG